MLPLELTLTDAGLAAVTAADGTDRVVITGVGLTAADIVAARTLTVLPGEFKRLADVSGEAVDARTIHLMARDESQDGYTVRAFGLFLADGTLLAVYGQPTPIFQKSPVSTFLLAQDIRFQQGQAELITFGDANFLYPPATEIVKGVAEIATQAETDAGADDSRIVSPKKLAARLAAIVVQIFGRKVLTAGLVTGGGDLSADRTITVPSASPEEALAGAVATKAVTPASLALILLNIADRVVSARQILTSGLATGGGDLTADRTIHVPAASAAEADAGAIASKALVPASLVNILAAITARVVSARQILTSGLATGGGDLTADRTIEVPRASTADLRALTSNAAALTPASYGGLSRSLVQSGHTELPDGTILKWGRFTTQANGIRSVSFPVAFPNECFSVVTDGGLGGAADQDNYVSVIEGSITAAGFQAGNGKGSAYGATYWAVGK